MFYFNQTDTFDWIKCFSFSSKNCSGDLKAVNAQCEAKEHKVRSWRGERQRRYCLCWCETSLFKCSFPVMTLKISFCSVDTRCWVKSPQKGWYFYCKHLLILLVLLKKKGVYLIYFTPGQMEKNIGSMYKCIYMYWLSRFIYSLKTNSWNIASLKKSFWNNIHRQHV